VTLVARLATLYSKSTLGLLPPAREHAALTRNIDLTRHAYAYPPLTSPDRFSLLLFHRSTTLCCRTTTVAPSPQQSVPLPSTPTKPHAALHRHWDLRQSPAHAAVTELKRMRDRGPISSGMCITPSFVMPSGTDNAVDCATPCACCMTVSDAEQPLALTRRQSFDTKAMS
jgi:hypothetical protein